MSSRFATLFTVAVLGVAAMGLSACNTVSGAGKDVSALGHDTTRAANSSDHAIVNKTGASAN